MAKAAEKTEDAAAAPGGKGKLLILIVAVVLLLGGAGAGAYFFLMGGEEPPAAEAGQDGQESAAHEEAGHDEHAAADKKGSGDEHGADAGHGDAAGEHAPGVPGPVFVDMPDVLVNLRSDTRRMRFLKLRVALEVDSDQAAQKLTQVMPRVLDSFQLYLRDLTLEELNGSEGLQRLKEELMARVNIAIEPVRVEDILFKEMLVQ